MKIVPYTELKDKEDIYLLWLKSFGWGGTVKWLEECKKYDFRIGNIEIGMCGLIRGKLVGFVGMMDVPTRTKSGEIEHIGGIWGIATLPSYERRGIARKLLEACEDYFRENNYSVSFLTTSHAIVAYKWYAGVGYNEVEIVNRYPHLFKTFNRVRENARKNGQNKFKISEMRKIYDWYTRDKCGFVIRENKGINSRELSGVISRKLSFSVEDGYALVVKNMDTILIKEIIARNQKTYRHLIKLCEEKAKYGVCGIHVFDPNAQKVFENMNYKSDRRGYDVLMWKSLDGTTFNDLYNNKFLISKIDWF